MIRAWLDLLAALDLYQVPLLEPGDIIIDGGNSEYRDTTVSKQQSFTTTLYSKLSTSS